MILAPYKFKDNSGWQGVSHPGVFKDNDGQYYMGHQGRQGENSFFMVINVRKIYWTEDGWLVVSPERYANVDQTEVLEADLIGNYEQIIFGYRVVLRFSNEQRTADFQFSQNWELSPEGTINVESANTWSFEAPWLNISMDNGAFNYKLYLERGRDWENRIVSTILIAGLDNQETAIWAKKIE